jgi:hypothetical protein
LNEDDLRRFARDGYLVVPGVVPESLLTEADDEIDALKADVPPDEGDGGPGVNAWFSPRARLPRCEAVLRASPALAIADELVAPMTLDLAFDHIHVSTTTPPYDHVPGGPHIDGHGPDQHRPASFTLLAGVLLAHFLLGHNKGGNTSDHERRTLYYRLAVPGHADRWEATFLDAWTEYAPVRRHAERS